jgi:hypothetical protein
MVNPRHNTLVCSARLVYSGPKVFANALLCKPSSSDGLFRSRGSPKASHAQPD